MLLGGISPTLQFLKRQIVSLKHRTKYNGVFRKLFVCLLEAGPTLHAIPEDESQLLESLVLEFQFTKTYSLQVCQGNMYLQSPTICYPTSI
jgi:hypothetical protein